MCLLTVLMRFSCFLLGSLPIVFLAAVVALCCIDIGAGMPVGPKLFVKLGPIYSMWWCGFVCVGANWSNLIVVVWFVGAIAMLEFAKGGDEWCVVVGDVV